MAKRKTSTGTVRRTETTPSYPCAAVLCLKLYSSSVFLPDWYACEVLSLPRRPRVCTIRGRAMRLVDSAVKARSSSAVRVTAAQLRTPSATAAAMRSSVRELTSLSCPDRTAGLTTRTLISPDPWRSRPSAPVVARKMDGSLGVRCRNQAGLTDVALLEGEATAALRGPHAAATPSHDTLGRFCGEADLGRVSKAAAVNREMLARAWALGGAPETDVLTLDPMRPWWRSTGPASRRWPSPTATDRWGCTPWWG